MGAFAMNYFKYHFFALAIIISCSTQAKADSPAHTFIEFSPFASSTTPADIQYGQQQVGCMIHDRPQMAKWIKKGGPIEYWITHQFAGEFTGGRVSWNNYFDADSFYRHKQSYSISVPTSLHGHILNGEQMWAKIVFEFFQMRSTPDSLVVTKQIPFGKISKEAFIRQMAEFDYKSLNKSILFYKNVWLPETTSNKEKSDAKNWGLPTPMTFNIWFSQFKNRSAYPWNVYGPLYEKVKIRGVESNSIL